MNSRTAVPSGANEQGGGHTQGCDDAHERAQRGPVQTDRELELEEAIARANASYNEAGATEEFCCSSPHNSDSQQASSSDTVHAAPWGISGSAGSQVPSILRGPSCSCPGELPEFCILPSLVSLRPCILPHAPGGPHETAPIGAFSTMAS